MKPIPIFLIVILGSILSLTVFGCDDRLEMQIEAVRRAPNPSVAITAYGKALAVAPDSAELHSVYVRRMVDFGLPEFAIEQAELLADLEPDNGLAWAVIAFDHAQKGEMVDAVYAIERALQDLEDDPFVLSTAGQIIAWYDNQPADAAVPDDVRITIANVRQEFGQYEAFAMGYKAAREQLNGQGEDIRPDDHELEIAVELDLDAETIDELENGHDDTYSYTSYVYHPYYVPNIVTFHYSRYFPSLFFHYHDHRFRRLFPVRRHHANETFSKKHINNSDRLVSRSKRPKAVRSVRQMPPSRSMAMGSSSSPTNREPARRTLRKPTVENVRIVRELPRKRSPLPAEAAKQRKQEKAEKAKAVRELPRQKAEKKAKAAKQRKQEKAEKAKAVRELPGQKAEKKAKAANNSRQKHAVKTKDVRMLRRGKSR